MQLDQATACYTMITGNLNKVCVDIDYASSGLKIFLP